MNAGEVIQDARNKHELFARDWHPNVVALTELTSVQRVFLKRISKWTHDRFSRGDQVALKITGDLVGVDVDTGVPFSVSTAGDGFTAIVDDLTGVVFLGDFVVTLDPFKDGFPLPTDLLEIMDIRATMEDDNIQPVDYDNVKAASRRGTSFARLHATVVGFRLIPSIDPAPVDRSLWNRVKSVTIVWVEVPPRLTKLDDEMVVHHLYREALAHELASFFARREHSRNPERFPANLVSSFEGDAQRLTQELIEQSKTEHSVIKHKRTMRVR